MLVNGEKIADEIMSALKTEISEKKLRPRLAVFLVGRDPASLSYISKKKDAGASIGVDVEILTFPETVSEEDLIREISKRNGNPEIAGVIIQLPLPGGMDRRRVLDAVSPGKDVDCLTAENQALLAFGKPRFTPPAAAGVLKIFQHYKVDLREKRVLLIGAGELIGKPLAALLKKQGIDFSIADRSTGDLPALTKTADVIVSGAGKAGLLAGEMIKDGAVVIDAGTTGAEDGAVVGDIDTPSVAAKAGLLAAVPGGLGPVTVAMLLQNVVSAARESAGD